MTTITHTAGFTAATGFNFEAACTCGWRRGIAGTEQTAIEAVAEHIEFFRPKTAAELFAKL